MSFASVIGGIGSALSAGLGLFGTGYNIYTNKRDFDYQKALQQQMFNREDTAVQRRVEDLRAAGLNENLAAGSAAGAGSVVSRSSTNDINPGAALDYMNAWKQIKGQTIANEINSEVREQEKARTRAAMFDEVQKEYDFAVNNGLDARIYIKNGKPYLKMDTQLSTGKTLTKSNYDATIQKNDWIPQQQKNELQKLINEGQALLDNKQKLILEQQKLQVDTIYKKWQMNETTTYDMCDYYAKLFGLSIDAEKLKMALDKLQWDKDKWSAEMLIALFNGLSQTSTDSLGL